MRVTVDGLIHFLDSDFDGFFDFVTEEKVPDNSTARTFRSYQHSFWHDDPTTELMRNKYTRRIARFGQIDASSSSVLFVRAAATSEEVKDAGRLLECLQRKFGPEALLLMVLDFQGKEAMGPITVEGHDNLLLYFLDTVCGIAPYCAPVRIGLDWAAGREIPISHVDSLTAAHALALETDWGLVGTGGVLAFEGVFPASWAAAVAA